MLLVILCRLNRNLCSQELRAQLSQERDNTRHSQLQKDLELRELRTRIDKTVSSVCHTMIDTVLKLFLVE